MSHQRRNKFRSRIITTTNVFLILLLVIVEARYDGSGTRRKKDAHRIFPAAKVESYNIDNLPQILGMFSSNDEISFSTYFFSDDPTVHSKPTEPDRRHCDTKSVNDILKPAFERFRASLQRYPDFRHDYPVNPTGLPLVPMESAFLIGLNSSDVSLYHGVPEDYEIHASISPESNSTDNNSNSNNQYISNVNRSGTISITATTVFGVLRAIETLGQLLEFGWMDKNSDGDEYGIYVIRDMPIRISDEPTFPYRGLMIDTARHYLPLELILDNLDAMAMNKMNVLHWHISDSQSFPYAPKDLPELAKKGAYHPRRIYSSVTVRTIVREAYLRGIRVIPEIDMPGHTNAIAASHPEVMSHCPDPSEPMNPTVPETYDFVKQIYKDLDSIFPDNMVHVGGDEVELSEACWLKDPLIAAWMKDHGMSNRTVELYEYFETRLLKTISSLDKTPIVWQEVFDLNLTIPKDTIIDVWKGFDKYSIQNATNQGHRVILSGCWYLDHLDQTWQSFYECDPLDFESLNKELMIGGHASMWSEHCDASNFVSRVWPRASSAAERLWSGTSSDTIAERIHKFRCRMVLLGFDAGPTGPGVCPTEVSYAKKKLRENSDREIGTGMASKEL